MPTFGATARIYLRRIFECRPRAYFASRWRFHVRNSYSQYIYSLSRDCQLKVALDTEMPRMYIYIHKATALRSPSHSVHRRPLINLWLCHGAWNKNLSSLKVVAQVLLYTYYTYFWLGRASTAQIIVAWPPKMLHKESRRPPHGIAVRWQCRSARSPKASSRRWNESLAPAREPCIAASIYAAARTSDDNL